MRRANAFGSADIAPVPDDFRTGFHRWKRAIIAFRPCRSTTSPRWIGLFDRSAIRRT